MHSTVLLLTSNDVSYWNDVSIGDSQIPCMALRPGAFCASNARFNSAASKFDLLFRTCAGSSVAPGGGVEYKAISLQLGASGSLLGK
jgi:hypothetical protein